MPSCLDAQVQNSRLEPILNSWPWQQGPAKAGVGKHSKEEKHFFPEIPSPPLLCLQARAATAAGASPLSPVLGINRPIKHALVPCPGAILGATLITAAGK